jgi:hypothetical protein
MGCFKEISLSSQLQERKQTQTDPGSGKLWPPEPGSCRWGLEPGGRCSQTILRVLGVTGHPGYLSWPTMEIKGVVLKSGGPGDRPLPARLSLISGHSIPEVSGGPALLFPWWEWFPVSVVPIPSILGPCCGCSGLLRHPLSLGPGNHSGISPVCPSLWLLPSTPPFLGLLSFIG